MVQRLRIQEKLKPHHDLQQVKEACSDPNSLPATETARLDAAELGFDLPAMVSVVQSIARKHFQKSMTSLRDHARWQDVYHVPADIPTTGDTDVLYIKFTDDKLTEFRLLSFKLKEQA